MSNFNVYGKEIRSAEEHSHVAIEMCRMDPHRDGMLDLGAELAFGIFRFDVLGGWAGFRPKISGWIDQTWHLVLRFNGSPSICFPFARESEVQAEIGVGMCLGVVGNLG